MPNWCVGTLKVRGKIENIKKWIEEGVECCNFFGDETAAQPRISEKYGELEINIPKEGWIRNSRRNFISGKDCIYDIDDRVYGTMCFDICAAWGFEPNVYKNLSSEYELDFRLQGFEKGMQFEQILEVINGEITIDKEIKYEEYEWEVYDPRLGG